MSLRSILIVAIAAMGVPAAFAQSTSAEAGGPAGWVSAPAASVITRAEVRSELQRFVADPTGPDGGRYVGGEQGYVMPMHSYAYRDGHWVCTDKIAHNPKPDATMSPAEAARFQQRYPA